jgi:iron-sulfur cluster assembly protein
LQAGQSSEDRGKTPCQGLFVKRASKVRTSLLIANFSFDFPFTLCTFARQNFNEHGHSNGRKKHCEENIPADYCLRIGVKGGGCSGFSYVLGFDQPQEGDDRYEINGINVVMNKAHAIYLLGMEIDFVSGLDNRGFTFDNPNAKSTCGCGTSFSA